MFKSNLTIAWRNLVRNRVFSLINSTGLILGMAVFLLIMEYVAFEWGANRFNENYRHIYRASVVGKDGKGQEYLAPGSGPLLKKAFPVIDNMVRIGEGVGNGVISTDDGRNTSAKISFREDKMSFVDGDFFSVFSYPLVYGSPSLHQPKTLSLSQTMSEKLYGKINPVGKTLTVSNQFGTLLYTVNSVYKDMPAQSDIQANVLISYSTLESAANRNRNDWADPTTLGSEYAFIYFKLKNGADEKALAKSATSYFHQLKTDATDLSLVFQPLKNLHLAPSFDYNLQTYGSLKMVVSFAGVALLILFIAWINYINLSTAQALKRTKEVGVRKVLGANKRQLIVQYLSETSLITFISLIGAVVTVVLVQPLFNRFTGQDYSLALLFNSGFLFLGLAFILCFSILAGSYVAFILSSFNPIKTLKGQAEKISGGISLRKALVVFQFTASVIFIIATIVLYRQLSYMQTKNLGMAVSQRMVVAGPSEINVPTHRNASLSFENELARLPFVEKYAASNNVPGQGYNFSTAGITRMVAQPGDEKKSYAMLIIDDKFLDTYGIKLKDGSGFNASMLERGWPATGKVMLNESAVKQLGFKDAQSVVGQKISWGQPYEVVGVVKDYHHLSLRESIKPMIFLPAVADGFFTIKMNTANMQSKVGTIRAIYKKLFPDEPFTYSFADETYNKQYKTEQQLGGVFIASAFIAVLIACLGLFGLATFAARQRIKEIGIRKVLGAGVSSIVMLISGGFLRLVMLSILVAAPIAWYVMDKWLQNFAYRISISWWMFALAGLLAVVIAFATVGIQALKAAWANPVKSLRSE